MSIHDSKRKRPASSIGEKDAVLHILGEDAQPVDEIIARRVLRKIDYFFMPAMLIGYGMVYYDKVSESLLQPSKVHTKRLSRRFSAVLYSLE